MNSFSHCTVVRIPESRAHVSGRRSVVRQRPSGADTENEVSTFDAVSNTHVVWILPALLPPSTSSLFVLWIIVKSNNHGKLVTRQRCWVGSDLVAFCSYLVSSPWHCSSGTRVEIPAMTPAVTDSQCSLLYAFRPFSSFCQPSYWC